MNDRRPILFAGLGSPHGDDRIGWLVADRLAHAPNLSSSVTIRKAAVPLDLLDWLDGAQMLHLCDAAETSAEVGELSRWDWQANGGDAVRSVQLLPILQRLPARGSHDFELPGVLDLAAKLQRLPGRIIVWTIAGHCFEPGESLSAELRQALPHITATIAQALSQGLSLSSGPL